MRRIAPLLSALLAACPAARAVEAAPPAGEAAKPYLMATLGDSISAALFAGTSLTELNVDVSSDEVDAAWNHWRVFEKKYTLSWSAGSDIPSHFQRLKDYLKTQEGVELDILNTAVTGNMAEDLVGQARQVYAAVAGGKYRGLKYATIMIGANDVCDRGGAEGTPGGVLRDSLKAALGILASIPQEEPVRVLVSAIPNVPSLGAEAIRNRPFYRNITCGDLWAKIGICQRMLFWKSREEYEAKLDIVARKNQVIRSALSQAKEDNPNLRVAYSDKIFRTPAAPENMAIDCFHPNQGSQQKIAGELWQDQPWFPPQGYDALARAKEQLAETRHRVHRRLRSAARLLPAATPSPVVP